MEKVYTNRVAYGIHVIVNGNSSVNEIMNKYKDVISYSSAMSLLEKGSIFVYLKSSYHEPKYDSYDYIHIEDISRIIPNLSERENEAINEILNLCYCNPKRLMWIQHADVFIF